jgi:transcriptional regulator with XRE-family HTH domain
MRKRKPINIEIGANIQRARDSAGYTQEQLSEIMGLTPNHLSAIERGTSGISLESLQKLCYTLGISADSIIFGDTSSNNEAQLLAVQILRLNPNHKQHLKKIFLEIMELLSTEDTTPE